MFLVSTTAGEVPSVPFINELDSIHRTLSHSDENRMKNAIEIDTFGSKPLFWTYPSASKTKLEAAKVTPAESGMIYMSNLTLEIEPVILSIGLDSALMSWRVYVTTRDFLLISSSSCARAYNLVGRFLRAVRSRKHATGVKVVLLDLDDCDMDDADEDNGTMNTGAAYNRTDMTSAKSSMSSILQCLSYWDRRHEWSGVSQLSASMSANDTDPSAEETTAVPHDGALLSVSYGEQGISKGNHMNGVLSGRKEI
ncbi:hypothetical protein ARMGADRAFT_1079153 [Armillaria gallica]|uniref:Uncharacterized protein n=1 Tax=Armillaria gallica TaxID=47427 RepID=A0A2H3DUI7_ARMGA|nr:hypothetical protein ARMGADRAFT_1079153 [Armillaria gallica]